MPSIKDQSTVKAIAVEFTSNGRKAELALKAVGYTDNYAEHRSKCVLSNVGVKAAIAKIDAESAETAEVTKQTMQVQYDEDRVFAKKCNSPAAMISASIAKARLYALDIAASTDTDQDKELTQAQKKEAQDYIKWKRSQLKPVPRAETA